jgi:hypothetical protein
MLKFKLTRKRHRTMIKIAITNLNLKTANSVNVHSEHLQNEIKSFLYPLTRLN